MKTATASKLGQRAAWVLGATLVFAHTATQACPGCKQNMTPGADGTVPPLNGTSLGFGISIFFMIFMIVALLGGLGMMMYRSCRAIAARQQAMLEAEDAMSSGGYAAAGQQTA